MQGTSSFDEECTFLRTLFLSPYAGLPLNRGWTNSETSQLSASSMKAPENVAPSVSTPFENLSYGKYRYRLRYGEIMKAQFTSPLLPQHVIALAHFVDCPTIREKSGYDQVKVAATSGETGDGTDEESSQPGPSIKPSSVVIVDMGGPLLLPRKSLRVHAPPGLRTKFRVHLSALEKEQRCRNNDWYRRNPF